MPFTDLCVACSTRPPTLHTGTHQSSLTYTANSGAVPAAVAQQEQQQHSQAPGAASSWSTQQQQAAGSGDVQGQRLNMPIGAPPGSGTLPDRQLLVAERQALRGQIAQVTQQVLGIDDITDPQEAQQLWELHSQLLSRLQAVQQELHNLVG